jgi:hypothetical protein
MKITRDSIIDESNLIGHIVIEGVSNYPDIIEAIVEADEAEVIMTVNGKEIDLEGFIKHWQSQVGEIIRKEARSLINEKFSTISYKMDDISFALDGALEELTNLTPKD